MSDRETDTIQYPTVLNTENLDKTILLLYAHCYEDLN